MTNLPSNVGLTDRVSSLPLITPRVKPHVDFQVYCDVEPKRQALAQANFELAAATEKLEAIRKKLEVSAKRNTKEVPKRWHLPPLDRVASESKQAERSLSFHRYTHFHTHSVDTFCLLYAGPRPEKVETLMISALKNLSWSDRRRKSIAHGD